METTVEPRASRPEERFKDVKAEARKDVKVEAKEADNGDIEWEIDGKKPKESVLEFDKGSGKHTVEFKLHSPAKLRLRFNTETPIWVNADEKGNCPPEGATDSQIRVINCTNDTLELVNANSVECTLHYQLNFVNEDGRKFPVDPDFKNGGTNML